MGLSMRGGDAGGGVHGMDDGITGGVPYGVVQCGEIVDGVVG